MSNLVYVTAEIIKVVERMEVPHEIKHLPLMAEVGHQDRSPSEWVTYLAREHLGMRLVFGKDGVLRLELGNQRLLDILARMALDKRLSGRTSQSKNE